MNVRQLSVIPRSSEGVDFRKEKNLFCLFPSLLPCLCVSRTFKFDLERVQIARGLNCRRQMERRRESSAGLWIGPMEPVPQTVTTLLFKIIIIFLN